jgi:redox-sensitive bicupin YhaK (pirin superfamily)
VSTLPTNEPRGVDTGDHRALELVIAGRPRDIGSLTVARVLPSPKRRMVGPFIFIDHMGPVELAPGAGFDVRPHPHIGLSTVTYLFAGEQVHRDSLGNEQVIRPGDVNLMTAGDGIVHSERATPALRGDGGRLHGAQIWLALPDANEDDPPSFAHHAEAALPVIAPAVGVNGRVLLGLAFGARSPIAHPSAPMLVDLHLEHGASLELHADAAEHGVLVIEGALQVGNETLAANQLGVLCAQHAVRVTAAAKTHVLWLGGPTHTPRIIEWNFVASSRARIDRARDRWKARLFPIIPSDDKEFIPWPEDLR